ncbi:hypothetical protein THAOC_23093 [Thalassiosira oceanica]|uniref:Uncharacterized protein n=1 Tax=Thalassiosira oceanica TaxID=159749 RepID=K0SE32_THAOC|nr:hypothetical protein THAOC_23093 [Thalassiosira oceanica]|eukprot:EJK56922.1 hypothetical protein THAOC_23093 [Thalassiosira oceanica]
MQTIRLFDRPGQVWARTAEGRAGICECANRNWALESARVEDTSAAAALPAGGGADNESKMADDDEEDAFTPVIFFADKPASPSSPCCCLIDPFASIEEEKEEGERSSTNQTQPLVPVRLFPNIDASFESIRAHTEEVCEDELDGKTATKNDPFTPLIEFDCPMFTFPTDGLEGTSIAMSDGIFTFQSFGDTLKLSKEGSVEVYPRPFGFKRSARFTTYDWSQGKLIKKQTIRSAI